MTTKWDRSAESLSWSLNSKQLFVSAQEHSHVKIFSVNVENLDTIQGETLDDACIRQSYSSVDKLGQ